MFKPLAEKGGGTTSMVFEIGAVYLPVKGQPLPDEPRRLAILMTGKRYQPNWMHDTPAATMDFYDLKGVVDSLLFRLKISGATFTRADHPTFHPGRSAMLNIGDQAIGVLGELYPLVAQAFEMTEAPVLAAEFDLDARRPRLFVGDREDLRIGIETTDRRLGLRRLQHDR